MPTPQYESERPTAKADSPPSIQVERNDGVEAMLALAICLCLFGVFDGLWKGVPAFHEGWTITRASMLVKSVVCVVFACGVIRKRRFLWAAFVAVFALHSTLLGVNCALGAMNMVAIRHPLITAFAFVVAIAAVAALVGGGTMAYSIWKRHEAFTVPKHHRWRDLVRYGMAPTVLITGIDAYYFYQSHFSQQ
jgi:hypothetical protein